MVARLMQLKCAACGPDITASDKRKSAAINIGGRLPLYFHGSRLFGSPTGTGYVMALAPMTYILPYLLGLHYTSLKGRSGRAQAVLIARPRRVADRVPPCRGVDRHEDIERVGLLANSASVELGWRPAIWQNRAEPCARALNGRNAASYRIQSAENSDGKAPTRVRQQRGQRAPATSGLPRFSVQLLLGPQDRCGRAGEAGLPIARDGEVAEDLVGTRGNL
jgi:hypothetical protein